MIAGQEALLRSDDIAPPELLHLPDPIAARAMGRARQTYPLESCGLLIGRRGTRSITVHRMLPCRNQAAMDQQRRAFEIAPLDLIAAEEDALATGEELVGIVHSHCDSPPRPSAADLRAARLWPEMLWLILSLNDRGDSSYSAWWPGEQGLTKVSLSRPPTAAVLWSANS